MEKVIYIEKKQYLVDRAVENNLREAGLQVLKVAEDLEEVNRRRHEAEIFIYNREGLLVYHSDDYSTGWDGQSQDGTPCPQGNYVWKLVYRAVDLPHSDRIEAGSVLLLR